MDDSVSDDINYIGSSDEDNHEPLPPAAPVVINIDNETDHDTVEVGGSEDGSAFDGGQESPESDEVVVVDEGVILVEESDYEETSEDEDARGDEEEAIDEIPAGSASATSTDSRVNSQPNPPADVDPPTEPENQPNRRRTHTGQTQRTSSHGGILLPPTFTDNSLPGMSSGTVPMAGSSVALTHNTSLDDFQSPARGGLFVLASLALGGSDDRTSRSPKRRRIMSPVKKTDPEEAVDENDDNDDGNCCSICFEAWDNSGRHRLASLKCGHLFGLGCIEKWLKGQGGKCPTCNEKASMKDIRVIYAKAIKMVDTTDRDRALQELEKEKELRRHAELEAAQARLQSQQCTEESQRLRDEVSRLRDELSSYRSQQGSGLPLSQAGRTQVSHIQQLLGHFVHERTVKIWEGGQCRVLAYCPSMAILVISQPSANHLFPGHGIKKLSCMDFKTSSYLTLHQKTLRGLSFHQSVDDGILLSASMDKTVKLTSVIANNVVQTYNTTAPVWSCEWNADSQNHFYVGQQNGVVLEFDTRNTASHLRELNTEGSKSPVVALQYLSRDISNAAKPGGLIVGQLDRVSFFESRGNNDNRLHILPLEGSLTSLNVDTRTRHLLASFRPSAKHPSVRHQLCELTTSSTLGQIAVSCNVVHTFHGGRSQLVLGKSMLMPHPADDSRLLVVAGDEPSESAHVWDTGTSQPMQRLPCQGVPWTSPPSLSTPPQFSLL